MTSIGRALVFGFLVWLIPFGVAVAVFPLKAQSRSLFESIMAIRYRSLVLIAVLYFRRVRAGFLREGIVVGLVPVITVGMAIAASGSHQK